MYRLARTLLHLLLLVTAVGIATTLRKDEIR